MTELIGSWIIVNRVTGKGVCELFTDTQLWPYLNWSKYQALPAYTYLCNLNRETKQNA